MRHHQKQKEARAFQNLASIADLAELRGVKPCTIRRWIAAGELPEPNITLGRCRCWHTPALNAWLARRPSLTK